jgi:hypothetical protein
VNASKHSARIQLKLQKPRDCMLFREWEIWFLELREVNGLKICENKAANEIREDEAERFRKFHTE